MTYTIALKNGDWDFSTSRHGKVITGRDKLVQCLTQWLLESRGVDRFHPTYGSNIQSMVGIQRTEPNRLSIENEIRQSCNDYMNYISSDFEQDPAKYSKDEIIVQVMSVESYYIGEELHATVTVRTLSGEKRTVEVPV